MSYPQWITATLIRFVLLTVAVGLLPAAPRAQQNQPASADADPYLWLEDITGERALNWVRKQNAITTKELAAAPEFAGLQQRLLAIMDSAAKIPYLEKHGAYYYNFSRDAQHDRGLWRLT